uniref:Uncharacterized protein n=1 Tax=Rhizophora mucronata TaxID=61149 RepID=A0A2P2PJ14_RHIMU
MFRVISVSSVSSYKSLTFSVNTDWVELGFRQVK